MKENIEAYHIAEKQEALFMIIWGGLWLIVGVVMLLQAEEALYVGIAYSIIPLCGLQFVGGWRNMIAYTRRYRQIVEMLKQEEKKMGELEKIRILNIQIRLRFYRLAEQILFGLGFLFLLLGGLGGWSVFLTGSGIGLLLMSAVLLVQDLFAEWRSGIYLSELQSFIDDE
ncbi:MAG: hypothetical protein AAGI23_16035 [Bacteroidota bacterium]